MRQRTLTILQRLILLSLFSAAVSNESFLPNDIDYETLLSTVISLKEKCALHPDQPPCQYLTSIQKESEFEKNQDKIEQKSQQSPENETIFKDSEVFYEIPFVSSLKPVGKRFTVFRRKNPNAQSYKRGPGFRSWGGKRDAEKKSKFTSWGGKRDATGNTLSKIEEGDGSDVNKLDLNEDVDFEKKSKFTSWGGKRDFDDFESEKRNKFASWGGKRNNLDELDDVENKRSKFVSWGGKRDVETPISYDQIEKKGSYWGYYMKEPFKKHVPKRPQFQSWGGKRTLPIWAAPLRYYIMRSPSSQLQLTNLMNNGEKRKFSSWGGKRATIDHIIPPWEDKMLRDRKARQIFQNWGGKRPDLEDEDDTIENIFNNMMENPGERVKRDEIFNSWGGKREEEKVER